MKHFKGSGTDGIRQFVTDQLTIDDLAMVPEVDVHKAYRQWTGGNYPAVRDSTVRTVILRSFPEGTVYRAKTGKLGSRPKMYYIGIRFRGS